MTDWVAITERNARSVQTMIGWIFWDPGMIRRHEELGVQSGLGYVASRAAPLAPAGEEAVIAAFFSINPDFIRAAMGQTAAESSFDAVWAARDKAVLDGLRGFVPDVVDEFAAMTPWLWEAVDSCPVEGRVFYGAHLAVSRPDDPLLSAWHAVNCLREWRGDTHWAAVTAEGIGPIEAGILHNAWVGYDSDWLPRSRGADDDGLDAAWASLTQRGLAADGEVTPAGLDLRQRIEDRTNELTTTPWETVGEQRAIAFADTLEGPCERLLAQVDATAGPNYMPASRLHPRLRGN